MNAVFRIWSVIALVAMVIVGQAALAQQEFASQSLANCSAEIGEFCTNVQRGGGRLVRCLQETPSLSAACKAAVKPSDGAAGTASITVTLQGLKSKTGFVFVTLADDPGKFPAGRRTAIVSAAGPTIVVTFRSLKPSSYAVTAFHDENDNGKFDAGLFGAEGFAASNGASGAPSFQGSAVRVDGDAKIALSMVYY
jgi:uncharacterized protein (DUF2141 family)